VSHGGSDTRGTRCAPPPPPPAQGTAELNRRALLDAVARSSPPKGFGYWLLKFDGVQANRDKELEDPKGFTVIEYADALMAKAAGISMSECRHSIPAAFS
jgi:hypothetical protein